MASPVKQFEIKPLVPFEVAGFDLSFTNSAMMMMIGVVLSTLTLTLAMRKRAMVPGRFQAFAEMTYEFIANMIRENLGQHGRQYFPFIFTLFVIVLMGNMLGMVPYSFTYTSHIVVTLTLAMMVFLAVTVIGLYRHGSGFFTLFCPPGIPLTLAPLIVLIELISFLIRPITLSVRLFANMMAGHLVLKVFAGFSVSMGIALGIVPMAFNVLIIAFEFLIAFLQAYVFTILSCIYLKDTLDLHH